MNQNEEPAISIGVNEQTVKVARDTILEIISCDCEQKTIREALKTLRVVCEVKNTTISNCTFTTCT